MLTYVKAKEILSQWSGRGGLCIDHPGVDLFVKQTLQYLLHKGTYGLERKFCFCAKTGCITVPYELETPIKVKLDSCHGTVWDKWFEWRNPSPLDNCLDASHALYEEPNLYSTVYDLPKGGARIGVISVCDESEDANVLVQGYDATGREIYTIHKGIQISGEYLTLKKDSLQYTHATFAKIKNIQKTKTKGYVRAYWVLPGENELRGFLSDYSPLEEIPAYRRYRITAPWQSNQLVKVTILGRIRLKENYADEDIIPFDNITAIELAGQTMNALYNNDVQTAIAKDQFLSNTIEDENSIKKPNNGQPMEIFKGTSMGRVNNIVR